MKKVVYILLVALLAMSSCVNRNNFRFGGVDNVDILSMSKMNVTVTVDNSSCKNIKLDDGRVVLTKDGFELGQLMFDGEVVIPKRSSGQIVVPMRVKLTDVLGLVALTRNFDKGSLDDVLATCTVKVKVWPGKKKIEFKDVPVSKILTTFGIDPDELKLPI